MYDYPMVSEQDLIDIITRRTGAERDDVILGIGDDAAVLRPPAGCELVLCTDTLVEGVHFFPGADASAVGHKSLAVNLSDLAAMGAEPAWALLGLTLPTADTAWIEEFATGFSELAVEFGVRLAGGDTTRGPLTVTVQLAGFVPAGRALRRAGALAGDGLFVSGTLGDAAAALAMLEAGAPPPAALRERLERPRPRVELGLALRERAHAVIDVSDGLLADAARLLEASGCGADIDVDAVPRSREFVAAGGTLEMMLAGGDDYELLCALPDAAGLPLARIGTVTEKRGIRCRHRDGSACRVAATGYRHFA